MGEYKLTVRPFLMGTDKEAALKPLEEASEAHNAWACFYDTLTPDEDGYEFPKEMVEGEREMLADEVADCIQACCNLADRYGIDLQEALERVETKNRERGRYE